MNEAQAKELVETLQDSTKAQKVVWQSNATNDGFWTEIGDMTVEVRRTGKAVSSNSIPIDGKVTFVLEVRNSVGRPIANFRDDGMLLSGTFVHGGIIGAIPSVYLGIPELFNSIGDVADTEIARLIRTLKKK